MTTFLKHTIIAIALLQLTACSVLDFIIPKGVADFVLSLIHI